MRTDDEIKERMKRINAVLFTRPLDCEQAKLFDQSWAAGLDAFKQLYETFAAWFAREEVQAEIRRWQQMIEAMAAKVEAVDAPGYTPYFERLGHNAFSARCHAGLIRHFAKKLHEEAQERRVALSAFHDLAKRPRWHPALARQVGCFRDHCWNADFLDEAFRDAGCPDLKGELLLLLDAARGGDWSCGPRLLAIVAQVAPYAPSPRGRPQRFETVLHQTFLRWSAEAGGRQAYTYGPVPGSTDPDCSDDYTDEATAATRTELRRSSFDPVAARRAERRSVARKARSHI